MAIVSDETEEEKPSFHVLIKEASTTFISPAIEIQGQLSLESGSDHCQNISSSTDEKPLLPSTF